MADDKKPKDKKDDKKTVKEPSLVSLFIAGFIIVFVLWIILGGPQRNPEGRDQPFIYFSI